MLENVCRHFCYLYSSNSNHTLTLGGANCVRISTFFRQAHTVTALVLIAVGLFYVSIVEQTPDDTLYNVRRGIVAVVIVFILIGVIHMPDGPFVRPHPVVWRLVLCVLILYVLLLIFALFQVSHLFLSCSLSLSLSLSLFFEPQRSHLN